MMKRFAYFLLLILISVSCESEYQTAIVTQEGDIDKYITNNFKDNEVVRNNGSNRIIITNGYGNTVESGDRVSFYYSGYIFGTDGPTDLFTENQADNITIGNNDLIEGLDSGIIGMKKGEESIIIFTAKKGYGKGSLGSVPEASALLFVVTVNSISKKSN